MTIRQHRMSTEPDVSDYLPPDDVDHGLNEDWEKGPVALNDTSEGMAYQDWHLTYDPTTPPGYNPDMMRYDGVTGYYNDTSITTAGNKITVIIRFKHPPFLTATTVAKYIVDVRGASSRFRPAFVMQPSDADIEIQQKVVVYVRNSAGAEICQLLSTIEVTDDVLHILFFSFDGDSGLATFIIDGQDVDDTGYSARVAPTTGTLDSGSGTSQIHLGINQGLGVGRYFDGDIGYFGYKDAYLTNWSDFMDGSEPKELDEVTWTEWGGQPAFWNEDGEMTASLGTAGNMTKNGTIFKVNIGNYQYFALTPDDTGVPITVLSGVNSVQCSFAFDQNGQPAIAWIDGSDGGHIWWFDIQTGQPEIFDFQNPVTSVALCLDDKRAREVGINDILLFYTIPAAGPDHYSLHNREQRDRFLTDYPMADPVWPYIHKLGMNSELRVQITTSTEPPA